MLFRSVVAPARKVVAAQQRNLSVSSLLQRAVWGKSTINYIAYVLVGCVAAECIYGGVTDMIWDSNNMGKLYHQINWSKFKNEELDEEEE